MLSGPLAFCFDGSASQQHACCTHGISYIRTRRVSQTLPARRLSATPSPLLSDMADRQDLSPTPPGLRLNPNEMSFAQLERVVANDPEMSALQPLICRLNNSSLSPRTRMEQEKRIRREIANSNERRRMQSINIGFQNLKALLPKRDGEKMSKASILQQSVQHIRRLQAEKTQLLQQNYQLKQVLELRTQPQNGANQSTPPAQLQLPPTSAMTHEDKQPASVSSTRDSISPGTPPDSSESSAASANGDVGGVILAPPKKRKMFDTPELSDEGICCSDADTPTSHAQSPKLAKPVPQLPQMGLGHVLPPSAASLAFGPQNMKDASDFELQRVRCELQDLRNALDKEHNSRLALESHMIRSLELSRLMNLNGISTNNSRLLPLIPPTPAGLLSAVPSYSSSLTLPLSHSVTSSTASQNVPPAPQPIKANSPLVDQLVSQDLARAVERARMQSNLPSPRGGQTQNLQTIVDAIRHLEGDRLFVDTATSQSMTGGVQPVTQPLATIASSLLASQADSGIGSSPVTERRSLDQPMLVKTEHPTSLTAPPSAVSAQ